MIAAAGIPVMNAIASGAGNFPPMTVNCASATYWFEAMNP